MTSRLYYNDPYLLEFDAHITERVELEGEGHGVILDRTAFYPSSGGQPHDTGMINSTCVIDCFEGHAGQVVHVLDKPLESGAVHGSVDRERRIDHMQQHSGQHVLSQAFVELFGWATIGFHLGTVASTIDIETDSASETQLSRSEAIANKAVLRDKRVIVEYVDAADLGAASLGEMVGREGKIRVINIDGFHRGACGGTHVTASGQIGPILITQTERVRRQVRVEFLCGYRALRHARKTNKVLKALAAATSTPLSGLFDAVQAMRSEVQSQAKKIEDLSALVIQHEAASFPVTDGFAIAVHENLTAAHVRQLAERICAERSAVVLFATRSEPSSVVFAVSEDRSVDAGYLLKKVLNKFGGRGGGRRTLAQGGVSGLKDPAELLDVARQEAVRLS